LRTVLIASANHPLAKSLLHALAGIGSPCERIVPGRLSALVSGSETAFVYLPSSSSSLSGRLGMTPDTAEAEEVFTEIARLQGIGRLVLCSSALIYGTGPARQSLVGEDYAPPLLKDQRIPRRWRELEALARERFEGKTSLTILRPVTVASSGSFLGRRLARRMVITLPGHNPSLQVLSVGDLAEAIRCAVDGNVQGVFNVAPDTVVPLRSLLRITGRHRIPVPRILQRAVAETEALDYLRYPWTVSNERIRRELGFAPRRSSIAALPEAGGTSFRSPEPAFDEFGMDRGWIDSLSRTLFRFLARRYWRIEAAGVSHLPLQGRAVLVGTHRGFMPWDAVMALHLILEATGRVPRFLTHPGLLKFPFVADVMTRLGGVVACQESAARILENDEMLGVFPEGVRGAFARYRDAHRLHSFGRDAFVKMALRHRAPIIPFVTVGSAAVHPIFAQIRSRRWTRYSDWPCLPISTFPLLPFPLPSKWHTRFLEPMHVEKEYSAEAAQDAAVVKAISLQVRARMQRALDELHSKNL